MEDINIVLSSDDNYAQHVAVVMASIAKNTMAKDVCVYLLSDGISTDKKTKLNITAEKLGIVLKVIDLEDNKEFDALYTSGHISKAAYFRLAIPQILPKEVSKVIYMDVDALVLDDIQKLWSCYMQGKPLAAVADYGILASGRMVKQKREVIGLTENSSYFNSGVMVMDVEDWRKNKYAEKVIHLASTENLPHHDQDALNKVFMDNWEMLPLRWNVIPPIFNLFTKILFNGRYRSEAIKAKKNPAIFHYAGRYKPWEFENKQGFNDKYYEYLKLTEFKDVIMPQPSKHMQGKSIVRQMLRLKIADMLLWRLN